MHLLALPSVHLLAQQSAQQWAPPWALPSVRPSVLQSVLLSVLLSPDTSVAALATRPPAHDSDVPPSADSLQDTRTCSHRPSLPYMSRSIHSCCSHSSSSVCLRRMDVMSAPLLAPLWALPWAHQWERPWECQSAQQWALPWALK